MKAFWTILRLDLRVATRDVAVLLALGSLAALLCYAALNGTGFIRQERAAIVAAQVEEAVRFRRLAAEVADIEQGGAVVHKSDPREPLRVGESLGRRQASLPPGPLGALSVGQRDLVPHSLTVTTHARFFEEEAESSQSLAQRAAGLFDLAFVLVYLLPLVLIALCFDALSSERERGTLPLLLSHGVSVRTLLAAKLSVRLSLTFAMVLLFGLVLPLLLDPAAQSAAGLSRWLFALLLILAYAGFWLALSVWVGARGRSSSANALTLISVWLVLVVVLPGMLVMGVDAYYPTPSRVTLVTEAREAAREVEAELSAVEGNHAAPSQQTNLAEREVRLQAELEQRLSPVASGFEEQLAAQQALIDKLRYVSPAVVLYEALGDVSGSGVARYQAFSSQTAAYHQGYQAFFFDRVKSDRKLTRADYETLTPFKFVELPGGWLASRVGLALLGLLAPMLLLLVLARRGLENTPVFGGR